MDKKVRATLIKRSEKKDVGFTGLIKKNIPRVLQVDSSPNTVPVKVSTSLEGELYVRFREFCTKNRVAGKDVLKEALKMYLGSKTF